MSLNDVKAALYSSFGIEGALNDMEYKWYSTYLPAKLGNSISPSDPEYGAVGDGVTDDYAAIYQAIVDASTTSGVVTFQPGTYLINYPLHIPNNIVLDMRSGATIKKGYNSATAPGFDHAHAAMLVPADDDEYVNVSILGGTFDGNGATYTTSFVIIGGSAWTNVYIDGTTFLDVVDYHALDIGTANKVVVRNCKFKGFANKSGTRGYSEAIQLDPGYTPGPGTTSQNIYIEGCYFGDSDNADVDFTAWPVSVGNHSSNVPEAIHKNIKIVNNTFDGLTYAGIRPYAWEQVVISGNHFIGCTQGIKCSQGTGTKLYGCKNVVISGNTFTGTTTNGVWLEDNNSVNPDSTLHARITIADNVFDGVTTCIRALYTHGLTVTGNQMFTSTTGVNLTDEVKGCTVVGNYFKTNTSTCVFISGSSRDIDVGENHAYDMTGRFAHCTGATDAALRENISISRNVIVDCGGANAITVDSGASQTIQINANVIGKGDADRTPSGTEAIRSTVTGGGVQIMDNLISDELITKVVFGGSGAIVKAAINGSPEGVITAGIGSQIIRKDGGAGTSLYIKQSGTSNTGWVGK